jgi:hypothetical protein
MFAAFVALILLAACAGGIYLLLKTMGEEGVEVAAPGSCKSGKCGVNPRTGTAGCAPAEEEPFVEVVEVKREGAVSNSSVVH